MFFMVGSDPLRGVAGCSDIAGMAQEERFFLAALVQNENERQKTSDCCHTDTGPNLLNTSW
jgi:hypothetical protein